MVVFKTRAGESVIYISEKLKCQHFSETRLNEQIINTCHQIATMVIFKTKTGETGHLYF